MSLDQLVLRSDRVVTKAALSKYERGESIPRASVLLVLSRTLGLPTSHFLGSDVTDEASIDWLVYRRHSKLGARQEERIAALAEERVRAFLHLLRLLHPDEKPRLPPATSAKTVDDAENAAFRLRQRWGLGEGPIQRLITAAEDAGVLVVESTADPSFDALSGRTHNGFAVVVLNHERPKERVRFNLAHELGHLMLNCRELEAKQEEELAHRFAAAFLVPEQAVRHELGHRRTNLSTAELEHLQRKYGFSMQAWTRRARELGIITESLYRQWQEWFRSHGLHLRESADYENGERPQRLRVLCIQALAERAVDAAWIRGHCPEAREESAGVSKTGESMVRQLRRLQPEQRSLLLAADAEGAAEDYERDPEVREWLEFAEPIRSEEDMNS